MEAGPNATDGSSQSSEDVEPTGFLARAGVAALNLTERWLPDGFAEMCTEQQRQVRTVLVFAMAVVPLTLLRALMLGARGAYYMAAAATGAALVASTVPYIIKRWARVDVAVHLTIGGMVSVFVVSAALMGGFLGNGITTTSYLVLPPIAAMLS